VRQVQLAPRGVIERWIVRAGGVAFEKSPAKVSGEMLTNLAVCLWRRSDAEKNREKNCANFPKQNGSGNHKSCLATKTREKTQKFLRIVAPLRGEWFLFLADFIRSG
jgi:TFIIF-interacting CTD phosphatase-like protein